MGSHLTVLLRTFKYDVCAMGKSHQLALFHGVGGEGGGRPKNVNHAAINAHFQLVYGDLMGPFTPTAHGEYKFVSKITDQFTKWTAVYLLRSKYQALASLQLFVTSTVIPLVKRVIKWRADKEIEFTGNMFKNYCLGTGTTRHSRPGYTVLECVGRTLCGMIRCMLVHSGLPPVLWGELMMRAPTIASCIRRSRWKHRIRCFTARCRAFAPHNHRGEGVYPYQGRKQSRSYFVGRDGVWR